MMRPITYHSCTICRYVVQTTTNLDTSPYIHWCLYKTQNIRLFDDATFL